MKVTFAFLMPIKNDLILRAARGETTERTPIWVMRQAGRVLPEYRAVRKSAGSFLNLLKNPEAAAEVTIQPVDILGVDAAILFSDILVIPEAMGLPYTMDEGRGPWFENVISNESDLEKLSVQHIEDNLDYVFQTIRLIKQNLNDRVPLIGFAGAPWTIFCYMVEGKGSKTFSRSRAMLAQNPKLAHALLTAITDATIIYLKKQVREGCNMLQLFDSWAGILNQSTYNTYALPYLQRICENLREVPMTVFSLGAYFSLADLAKLPCETIGLDWHMNPLEVRRLVGTSKTLQGNLDPAVLYGNEAHIKKHTEEMLKAFGAQRHIANLGHGVYPDIEAGKLKYFIDTVKEYQYTNQ
jgi:uroporphyrinogen decarboxylase